MARSRERNWFRPGRNSRRKNATRKTPYGCRLGIEPLEERWMLSLTVPAFHSHPGATAKLYLDFDGSPAFTWNGRAVHGAGSNSTAIPAFTMDGDANNFTQSEIDTIAAIFNIVSEKFSPFNIDVTTEDPGNRTHGVTCTDIIGGSQYDWYNPATPAGGVSKIGSFADTSLNNFVFDWTGDLNWTANADPLTSGSTNSIDFAGGNTIPHEAGHAFGLAHERTPAGAGQPLNEYYDGDATRSPIMGNSANGNNVSKRGIWWQTNMEGGQQSPDPIQDELAIISGANNGFGYRADDWGYGNYFTMPAAADGSLGLVNGLIENTGDVDPFRFQAIGTTGTFKITSIFTAAGGGMLEPSGRIVDGITHQPISYSIVANGTTATLSSTSLVPGHDYFIEARSFGNYGDIGQYFVSGNLQGFASYNGSTRKVTVAGFGGNNNITISQSGNTLTVQDSLNGGSTATQNFTLSAVDLISLNLGGGDDTLNCIGINKADGSALPIDASNMGGGFDLLKLGGGSTFMTFDVKTNEIDVSFANGVRNATFYYFDAERVELHGTTSSSDLFNINSLGFSDIYAYGDQGNDKLVVSPAVMGVSSRTVIFYGGDGTDTMELDGSTLSFDQSFTMLGTAIQRFVPGSPFASEVQFDSTNEIFNIKGGSGNDTFQLLGIASGITVNPTGNGGNDTFRLGNNGPSPVFQHPFSGNIFGNVNVVAGTGTDLLYVDDVAWSGGISGTFSITNSYFAGGVLTQSTVTFDTGLDQIEYHASNSRPGSMTLFGIPSTTMLSLFGGTSAFDVLTIDDRNLQVVPFQADIGADSYKEYYGTPQSPTIRQLTTFPGFEQFKVDTHNNTTATNITGVPTGRTLFYTGGSNADTITVYPHDADGNLTINSDFSIVGSGGSDQVVIDDTGQANPIDYIFTNTFGGAIDRIGGMGAGSFSPTNDVENIILKAGDGDDTFDFNQHKLSTGVAIYGGDGNDVLNFGGDNLVANIANIASFLFDGQAGYNTENFRNANHTDGWVYGMSNTSETISQSSLSANYIISLTDANVQQKTVFAGPNGDTMQVFGTDAGQSLDFHGGDGDDALSLVSNPKFTAGRINFYGEGGANNRIFQLTNGDTVGSILHINANTIGAFPGDTFFAPGGSIYFDLLAAITLHMGSGADTAYIAPNATATISISGGNPTAAPGDTLNLALAAAQNYVLHGTAASGNVTSDNLKTLTYSGFETGPNIDDTAPYIVAQSYNDSGVPTILVQFSEDVSNALGVAYLQLINTTSAEQVPSDYLNMAYDIGTNTASFTFPGYSGGILPPGDYTATISGSLPDLYGNPLGVETPLAFTVATPPPQLLGDYNLNGEVDTSDYIVWRKTLGNAVTTFSGADGNGDGTIGPEDYDVWRANFGKTLPAAAGNEASLAKEQTRTESVLGSVTPADATRNATPKTSVLDSALVGRQSRTVFGSQSKTVNVASAFASACGRTPKSSTFQVLLSARLTADHEEVPLIRALNTVTDVRVAFEHRGQRFDNHEADDTSADFAWEAVDKVFESDWGSVDLIAI